MAHPNSHPYPLPFPNEVQRMQVASYSSLANALGTDPGYADQRGRAPRTTYDAVTDIQGIYLDEPPISTPLYPYPARNVLNPSTYLARTPLSVPSRSPSYTNVAWDHRDLTWRPSWYDRLPQPYFAEQDRPHGYQAGVEFPAIHFLRKGNKEPYSLSDLLAMDTMPDLVDGDSPILAQNPGRWIKIKLNVRTPSHRSPGTHHALQTVARLFALSVREANTYQTRCSLDAKLAVNGARVSHRGIREVDSCMLPAPEDQLVLTTLSRRTKAPLSNLVKNIGQSSE